ncbi:MAG: hypothetical protein KJ606_03410 [Chloroflexi bacterium]|nr:hypothetical protein [Chloroflexota bacterium]
MKKDHAQNHAAEREDVGNQRGAGRANLAEGLLGGANNTTSAARCITPGMVRREGKPVEQEWLYLKPHDRFQ